MTQAAEKAVKEIWKGRRSPVYLLHGDEFLAKEGAKAIVEALVPRDQQSLSVETIVEDRDLGSLPIRMNTLPLFGGTKVVVVFDSKAFVSGQSLETLARRSLEAWQARDTDRAVRLLLQGVAAAGAGEGWLDRAARGEITDAAWSQVVSVERDQEAEQWLREIAGCALADRIEIPETPGAGLARMYEEIIQRGIPSEVSLILTAEVVDERRALFKKISAIGSIIDCGIGSRRAWDTQMNPEAARAKIREMVAAAGKSIDEEALTGIVTRTGSSMRGLVSEMEKALLYIGTRPTVTSADVREVLRNSREANVFDLTNAVSGRDAGTALQAFRSLVTQREPVLRILALLAGEVRNLIVARAVLEGRLGGRLDPGVTFEIFRSRILPRLRQEIEGDDGSAAKLLTMNPFRAFTLARAASRFSAQGLLGALEAVHDADLTLKTSGQSESLIMEQLLIRLCAAV